MIVQSKETKTQPSLIELLGGTQKKTDAKNGDTFAKLLMTLGEGIGRDKNGSNNEAHTVKSVSADSKGTKKTQPSLTPFNAVIDPKNTKESSSLQKLLSGEDQTQNNLIPKVFTDTLSTDQVRSMINRAKEYLKNEITAKSPEYQANPKTLPKTLMGLVQLADKMGLNPQSITLSTLFKEPTEQANLPSALLTQPLLDTKSIAISPVKTSASPAFEAITQLLDDVKAKEGSVKNETKSESPKETKKEAAKEQPLTSLLQGLAKSSDSAAAATDTVATPTKEVLAKPIEPKSTVSAKTEGLISLLQGENKKEDEVKTSASTKNDTESSKIHQTPKTADAFEVKTKEAAQSMRYFATDLKGAVENYKPPFTRLTMTLNPEKLGEVEVTLVQRGNNVHVNIQSNNTGSVAFLAHNATELKSQLAHQGITNATINFMSGGEGQTQNQGQQQPQQNRFRAYESLKDLELNDEQLSALEIIIPHYA